MTDAVSADCETSEVIYAQVTVPGNVPPQVTMHPVEPSNTATSVAAAALAFNIRRLVLFAFMGRAFHLRVVAMRQRPDFIPDVRRTEYIRRHA